MGDPKGFMTTPRELPARRPVDLRLQDWREVYEEFEHTRLEKQAGRCMNCGIPFCHQGCPLGNLIPEWNDLVWRHEWREAAERLHATNNFPEFTGRLCPAPCESACVLGINSDPVTIKQVEVEIIDRAWAEGWVTPQPPTEAARAAAVTARLNIEVNLRGITDPELRDSLAETAGVTDAVVARADQVVAAVRAEITR